MFLPPPILLGPALHRWRTMQSLTDLGRVSVGIFLLLAGQLLDFDVR
jgi:hypothetical protein